MPPKLRVSQEMRDWYHQLPKGVLTSCYHCGHKGELTGPPMSGLCVDREACYERQFERRTQLWREYGSPLATCHICHRYGAVLLNPAGVYKGNGVTEPDTEPVCVDYRACNNHMCATHDHHWSSDQRHCVSQEELGFIGALANVGNNKWLTWRYCVRCGEVQNLMLYQEGDL